MRSKSPSCCSPSVAAGLVGRAVTPPSLIHASHRDAATANGPEFLRGRSISNRVRSYEPGDGAGSAVFLSGRCLRGGASGCAGAFAPGPGGGAVRSFGGISAGGCLRGGSGGASRFGGAMVSAGTSAFGCLREASGGASRFGGFIGSTGTSVLGCLCETSGGASRFGAAVGSSLGFRGAFSIGGSGG